MMAALTGNTTGTTSAQWLTAATGVPGPQTAVQTPLILNKDWAAKNRNAAIGLTKALQKAAVWVYDPKNKQKAINILAAFTNVPVDVTSASGLTTVTVNQQLDGWLTVFFGLLLWIVLIEMIRISIRHVRGLPVPPNSEAAFVQTRLDPSTLSASAH